MSENVPPAARGRGSDGGVPAAPAYRRLACVALVAAGGAVGTALRAGLGLLVPPRSGVPVVTVGINVVGAFALAVLLEALARGGDDAGARRSVRLFAGTGLLGAFTTYSALSTDTVLLLREAPAAGLAYALGTLVLGAAATVLGIAVASGPAGSR